MKIYCMSDIHGCLAEFEEALEIAKQYVGENPDIILMPEGSLTVPRVE